MKEQLIIKKDLYPFLKLLFKHFHDQLLEKYLQTHSSCAATAKLYVVIRYLKCFLYFPPTEITGLFQSKGGAQPILDHIGNLVFVLPGGRN